MQTSEVIKIFHKITKEVLFEGCVKDLRGANLSYANLSDANLSYANLSGANLSDANLSDAKLSYANLSYANLSDAKLSYANLSYANLSDANLSDANLSYANLSGAKLSYANLFDANLSDAKLSYANLSYTNLSYANLSGAKLSDANLSYANLSGANLFGTIGIELAIARTRILPDGDIIGWKKCKNNVIVKIRVPEQAKRSSAFSRKCRAEFVDVLEVIGSDKAYSIHNGGKTIYEVGKRVHCDNFCEDWMQECAGGIHFFITKEEAMAY